MFLIVWSIRISVVLLVTVMVVRLYRRAYAFSAFEGSESGVGTNRHRQPFQGLVSSTEPRGDQERDDRARQAAGVGDRGWVRLLWTVGAVLALVHVLAAFHYVHGWSHTAAVIETARRTREQIGFPVGSGVWFNYAFLLAWGLDVILSWLSPWLARTGRFISSPRLACAWRRLVDAYLFGISAVATVGF